MAMQQDYVVHFKIDAPSSKGPRFFLAACLVGLVERVLRLKVKCEVDTHKASRQAELEPNRDLIYRGVPYELAQPAQLSAEKKAQLDEVFATAKLGPARIEDNSLSMIDEFTNIDQAGWDGLEAMAKARLESQLVFQADKFDPSPQGHVRCQLCDYPSFKLADVNGRALCGWCAAREPKARCRDCSKSLDEINTYKIDGVEPLCWECFNDRIPTTE